MVNFLALLFSIIAAVAAVVVVVWEWQRHPNYRWEFCPNDPPEDFTHPHCNGGDHRGVRVEPRGTAIAYHVVLNVDEGAAFVDREGDLNSASELVRDDEPLTMTICVPEDSEGWHAVLVWNRYRPWTQLAVRMNQMGRKSHWHWKWSSLRFRRRTTAGYFRPRAYRTKGEWRAYRDWSYIQVPVHSGDTPTSS